MHRRSRLAIKKSELLRSHVPLGVTDFSEVESWQNWFCALSPNGADLAPPASAVPPSPCPPSPPLKEGKPKTPCFMYWSARFPEGRMVPLRQDPADLKKLSQGWSRVSFSGSLNHLSTFTPAAIPGSRTTKKSATFKADNLSQPFKAVALTQLLWTCLKAGDDASLLW